MKLIRIGFILYLITFRIFVFGQPPDIFLSLNQAIEQKSSPEIENQLKNVGIQIFLDNSLKTYYPDYLDLAHQLSRTGYADMVFSVLDSIYLQHYTDSVFAPEQKIQYINELGYACYYNKDFEKADSLFRVNIDNENNPVNYDISFSYNFLGLVHRRNGNLKLAIQYFEKAKDIRISLKGEDYAGVGSVYNNIGLAYSTMGDYKRARDNYEKAIQIKNVTNDVSVFVNYLNMGDLLGTEGNYHAAIDYYKLAEPIIISLNDKSRLSSLYNNMGTILNVLHANREAYEYFQKSLSLYSELYSKENENTAKVYQNLANVYDDLGEFRLEMEMIEKAISVYEKIYGVGSREIAPLFNNLGITYQKLKEFDISLKYFNKANSIYLNDSSLNLQIDKYSNTTSNIAKTYEEINNPDSAIYFYKKAIKLYKDAHYDKHPVLAYCYNALARIYTNRNNPDEASLCLSDALKANNVDLENYASGGEVCLDPSLLFESLIILGKLEGLRTKSRNARTISARKYFSHADSILATQRNFLFDTKDKIGLAKNSKTLAETALECYVEEEGVELKDMDAFNEVFEFIEKSKNLILKQSIDEHLAKHRSGIPDSLIEQEEQLLRRININSNLLALEPDPGKKKHYQELLFDDKKEHKHLTNYFEENFADYYKFKYSNNAPAIGNIQSTLEDSLMILDYFISGDFVYIISITQENCHLQKINIPNLTDLITGLRKGITLKLDQVYTKKAYELGKLLIPENIPSAIKKLVIIPAGGLSLIPFQALLTSEVDPETSYKEWPYLLKKYQISYSPSVSLRQSFITRRESGNSKKSLYALAPVFDLSPEQDTLLKVAITFFRSLPLRYEAINNGYLPLYESGNEVMSIDSLFKDNFFESKIALTTKATERNFSTDDLSHYTYIHLATHGFVDKQNPELSGLSFWPETNDSFDGILYTDEINNLKLHAELLTLSACETALGTMAKGEGILGFSRAFMFAGAKNLVLSLWNVNDHSTSVLMTDFYKNIIVKELSISSALDAAKLKMIKSKEYSHPNYWAPFILLGE